MLNDTLMLNCHFEVNITIIYIIMYSVFFVFFFFFCCLLITLNDFGISTVLCEAKIFAIYTIHAMLQKLQNHNYFKVC